MNLTATGNLSHKLIDPEILSLLTRIENFLNGQGIESYLVGGFVRDALLGRKTADIDIAVSAAALDVTGKLAAMFGGKSVSLDKINKVGRVVLPQLEIDISTFQGTIEEDLARRDFTVNAMAVDLRQFSSGRVQVIDPFDGRGDLQKETIRAVAETAFAADPVRLLRAVRLAVELGFKIDSKTETLIRRDARLIGKVPGERVREELLQLLDVAGAGRFLPYLDELGLLTAILPELEKARGVEQPKEHAWDVLTHSLRAVGAVEFLLRQGPWEYAGADVLAAVSWEKYLAEHFEEEISYGSCRKTLLKLAALLHDVAKPRAKALDATGRLRFIGHGELGAGITTDILEKLRFSSREIKLVGSEVRYHMRPGQMSREGLPTRRAIYRYFRDTEDVGIDILFLSLADHLAARGPNLNKESWRVHAEMVAYVLAQRFQEESIVNPPKLITGDDLINLFGLNPGPKIKEILEMVREGQAAGEIKTREEALVSVGNYLMTRSDKKHV